MWAPQQPLSFVSGLVALTFHLTKDPRISADLFLSSFSLSIWEETPNYHRVRITSFGVHHPSNTEELEELQPHQWWSVTKYNYFVTVLKYIFQVSVLYWSSFILSNFYFYFTTFQSIRSYFLLHYISLNISLLLIIHHVLRDAEAVYDSWTNWLFPMNLFNQFANRNKRFIHKLQWSDCSCSGVENSLIQMIRLERVFFSELNSQVKNREISWARATDAVKSTLLMSNFRIHYCNWK